MVGVMVRMKLTILRNGSGTRRTIGGIIGLALAIGTVLVSVLAPLEAVVGLLAAILAVWFVCWIAGPTGGSGGDETLRPEYFALEPVPVRTIMLGLLASSFVGVTVPVTTVATLSLFTLAIRFGIGAALVAVVAIPLTVVVIVLCSRVATAATGTAMHTRIGIEISALQNSAVLAAGFSIFMIYQAVSQHTDVFALLWNEGIAAPYSTVVLALPSGWGLFAVRAAGEGSYAQAFGALAGSAVLAVVLLVGMTFMVPLAGLIMVALAGLMSLNVYALDGSALWQTLLVPGAERRDVRGRQLAWLLIFVPVSVLVTVGGILITGQDWAWPWVAAVLPAMIGAGAGWSVLFAVVWPAPGPEPHRHGGNPLASGDPTGQFTLLFPILLICCAPPVALTALAVFTDAPHLFPVAIAVGVLEGALLGWGLVRVAHRRLERRGPELLDTLRRGWDATTGRSVERTESESPSEDEGGEGWEFLTRLERNLDGMSSRMGTVLAILGVTFWLPFYQGVASLIGILVDTQNRSWHLPLYLPEAWRLPAALGMVLLGTVMLVAMARILFRPLSAGADQASRT